MFVVMYGKFVEDKEDGIYLDNVFFGGLSDDRNVADKVAQRCVSTLKGGIIIPKVFVLEEAERIPEMFPRVRRKFGQLEKEMIDAEDITKQD